MSHTITLLTSIARPSLDAEQTLDIFERSLRIFEAHERELSKIEKAPAGAQLADASPTRDSATG
jgi:hypothetical protein